MLSKIHIETVRATIREKGCAIVGLREKGRPGAAYTVGLTERGMAELVSFIPGDDPEVTTEILEDMNAIAAHGMKNPEIIRPGSTWGGNGKIYNVQLRIPPTKLNLEAAKMLYPLGYQVLEMVYEPK